LGGEWLIPHPEDNTEAVRWSEDADKIGQSWITPISPDLRTELELYRSRRAEEKAKLPKLAGGRWHPYRRLFATELAHVPAKTASMLGGWKNPATMQRLYQQPTGDYLYAGAMEVGKSG
jgi:integrase